MLYQHPPVASNEIELTTRGTSSARPKSTLIDIDYHDDADERIMGQLHDLAACPTEKGCITIEMVTAEPGNPYVPVLDHLVAESSIRTVVFGFLGARWVNMVASHDTTLLNDQTARSVSFPHAIAHLLNMDGGDSSLKHSQSSQLDMARSNGATENGNTGNARSLAAMFRRPAHSHSRSSSDGRTSPATTSPRILPTAVAGAGVGDRTSPVMPAKASSRHSTSIIDTNRPQSLIVTSPRQDATMAANMAANQYTLPAGAQLPFDGLPATMEETMAATASGEFNPRSGQYIPRSSGHSHDRIAQRVLGDLGESLWNMPDIHVSLIAVRQFKH